MANTTATEVIQGIDKLSSVIDEQARLAKTFYEQTAALHKAISEMPANDPRRGQLVIIRDNLLNATRDLTANTATTSSTAAEVITTGTIGRR